MQWRTQKIFMGGGSFSGIWWSLYLVCAVCDVTIWRHIHVSKLFCKLSALRVGIQEEHTLNATTQQFITAKISSFALKHRSKTHSSLRQSNLQLQNEVALMSCRLRAVEPRNCAAGLAGAHPGLQDWILLNCTRIENAHKVRYARTLSIFCYA